MLLGILEEGFEEPCWSRFESKTFRSVPPSRAARTHGSLVLSSLGTVESVRLYAAPLSASSWLEFSHYLDQVAQSCQIISCSFSPIPGRHGLSEKERCYLMKALNQPGPDGKGCRFFFAAGNDGVCLPHEGWWAVVAEHPQAVLVGTPQGNYGEVVEQILAELDSSRACAMAASRWVLQAGGIPYGTSNLDVRSEHADV